MKNGNSKKTVKLPQNPGNVLYDTLYRYFVLFGFPKDENIYFNENCTREDRQYLWSENQVWSVLLECLNNNDNLNNNLNNSNINNNDNDNQNRTKNNKNNKNKNSISDHDILLRNEGKRKFESDRGVWGVHCGSHNIMKR